MAEPAHPTSPEPADAVPPAAEHWVFAGLFLLTAVTGVVDATSYLGLGRVFTANMTGNVLLLGFAATGRATSAHLSFVGNLWALAAFVAGALVGAAAGTRRPSPAHPVVGLTIEGASLAAALAISRWTSLRAGGWVDAVIVLLGLAMGVQNAVVRRMGVPDVNTTVLTTSLGGLAADAVVVGGRPVRAGRRAATVGLIFLGAVVGAALERQGVTWSIAAALVLTAAAALTLTRACRLTPER